MKTTPMHKALDEAIARRAAKGAPMPADQQERLRASLLPPEMIPRSAVKERGWTDAMVRDLLGEPDERRPNPKYGSAAPMQMYRVDRVEAAETTPAFAERRARAERRAVAGRTVAETKRAALLAEVDRVKVALPVIPRDRLIALACESYNDHHSVFAPNYRRDHDRATPDSDPGFLERIAVNFLRHEMTDYENELWRVAGKVGVRDAKALIREKVYGAIADAYPDLAAECKRQSDARRALLP